MNELSEYDIQTAAAFRRSVGLRFDEGWIRQVAASPDAEPGREAFGVPLTPDELRALQTRASSADTLIAAVEAYGEQLPDQFGGAFIDPKSGTVVASFVDSTDAHRAALDKIVQPGTRLELRAVAWPIKELRRIALRIAHDPWLAKNDYHVIGCGASVDKNVIELEVSSGDLEAPGLIATHYGLGPMLEVTIDGSGILNLPTGTLAGVVRDGTGAPMVGFDVALESDVPSAGGTGDVGTETDEHGRFELRDVAPTFYVVRIIRSVDAEGHALDYDKRVEVGRARVRVESGKRTFVEIVGSDG